MVLQESDPHHLQPGAACPAHQGLKYAARSTIPNTGKGNGLPKSRHYLHMHGTGQNSGNMYGNYIRGFGCVFEFFAMIRDFLI
jgi:hypothetical protein